jgi:hypothetical protein
MRLVHEAIMINALFSRHYVLINKLCNCYKDT